MADLAQFQDTQPVLANQPVESKATGYDAFAKTLGALSNEAASKTEQIVSDQSQAMYIQSVSNLEQLKTSSQMLMLEHPDQASKISDKMQESVDAVKQAAFVNDQDRVKLNAYASSTSDSVALEATKTNVHQTQLMAAYTHYANWPDQLKAYQQALVSGDDKQAENLKNGMMSSLKSLVSIGALSPEQAGSGIKTMGAMVDIARDHVAMYGNPNATAKDFHTLTSNPINPSGLPNTDAPINENTAWMVNYHSSDRSFQGVLSDVYNHTLPNPQAFDSLQPAQREHAILSMQGVRAADGLINSGATLPEIGKVYEDLNRRGRVLNYREMGLRNSLGTYLKRIDGGDYLEAIQSTPAGASIMQDYVNRNAAIQNAPISDADKGKNVLDNMNMMVNKAVAYGQGHDIPAEKIQPIPSGLVANVEAGFKAGNDPHVVLDTLNQLRNENKPWLAQAMKNPRQKMIVQTVGLSQGYAAPQDQLDYIAANQDGRDYLKINEAQDKTKLTDPKIGGLIASQPQFKGAMQIIGNQYDPYQTQILQRELVNSSVNYVKYLAAKNNDPTMSKKDDYIKQAANFVSTAFPQSSSTNYIANPRQLNLTPSQMDILAHYAVRQGEAYLSKDVKGSIFQAAISHNQLKMTLSPTNEVMAVDGNGKRIWSVPYSPNVLAAAQTLYDKETVEAAKLDKEMQNMRGAGGLY